LLLMLVVSGTLCSPTTKLLGHKGDLTKDDVTNDDILFSSLPRRAEIGEREKRSTGDESNPNPFSALPEILKSLGKELSSLHSSV
jgi:hypothetical protein